MYGGGCGSTREGEDKKEEETSVRTKMRRQKRRTRREHAQCRIIAANSATWPTGAAWTQGMAGRSSTRRALPRQPSAETQKRDDLPGAVVCARVSEPGSVFGTRCAGPVSVSSCADRCVWETSRMEPSALDRNVLCASGRGFRCTHARSASRALAVHSKRAPGR